MKVPRILLLLIIMIFFGFFFIFDLQQYLTLDALKSKQAAIEAYRNNHYGLSVFFYGLLYIVITGLSLPGATILTLAGGAIFGLLWGTIIVSFVSSIGATLAFLAARFLFRDVIKARFGLRLSDIDDGVTREGAFYLFTLRLVPVFPFFMINLAMGLTALRTRTFYWVSQVGMLAGTFVYVNAGTQLAKLNSLSGILSPTLMTSFLLVGLFPLLTKKIVQALQDQKIYHGWSKPNHFDNNIIVIGAGSAGLVTAYIATTVKAKVTLIEKNKMGGDCLNTGCVPSKALIRSTKLLSQLKRSKEFGIKQVQVDFDFSDIMTRVQSIIKTVEPHDSIERYAKLGVDVLIGEAKIVSPWEIEIKTTEGIKKITARSIILATGAHPYLPPIPGINEVIPLTSDTIWELKTRPKRLLVLGGGPIGCELAQCFARLGSEVTIVEQAKQLLNREDIEVSDALITHFHSEGITLLLEHTATAFTLENNEKYLIAECNGLPVKIIFDEVLIALGRTANIADCGAEEIGITLSPKKTIATNAFQETNYPNIYACGDVTGPYQFTHVAAHQAGYATVNALFGQFKKFRTDYTVIPWATFTDPEIARVGINEVEACAQSIRYEKSIYNISDLDRAITDSEAHGFVKVLTQTGSDKILGVTIVGEHAADIIAEFVLAMKYGIGLNKMLNTLHIYPTFAEANKYAAGVWKKAHAPVYLSGLLDYFHKWRRH
jgi:pyruvate/2-oxoglutarate dehydrogenase complex dihydrolipoamide dehydrogenase (E3) component/uncharacterized membrane protein YdjX (TVP38/TMEM64 family)